MKENQGFDPVCGRTISLEDAYRTMQFAKQNWSFCCPTCARLFEENPSRYIVNGKAGESRVDSSDSHYFVG